MIKIILTAQTLVALSLSSLGVYGQERVVSASIESASINGSISFTIGLVDNVSVSNSNGSISQGVQQTYEAFIESPIVANVMIPSLLSPNGDGFNDVWEIIGLSKYPNHQLEIYNRWGHKIFEASPYANNWDGTNTYSNSLGTDELTEGTYFYVLTTGSSEGVLKGYIYLTR